MCVDRILHYENGKNGGLCEVWRVAWLWWALVMREGLECELQKVGIKARVVENKPQGAKGGSMGVESRENMREESKNSKKASR